MNKKNSFLARNTFCILGLPFDAVDLDDSVSSISSAVDLSEPCFLSTPNLNFAIATQLDTAFFNSVIDSDLSVADGMPLIWVAKLLGIPINERVAGSTLFDELSKRPRDKKIKVFFFGGQEGIAEQAHHKLNEQSVGMISCGFYGPGFVSVDEMSATAIINEINHANPDFIVVALGAQKGQQWIQKNREQLKAPVISHLGAVVNFVAGSIDRAPVMWQRLGVEWLWRIKQEPSLWKRYWQDGLAFISLMLMKVLPLAIYDRYLKRKACCKGCGNIGWLANDNKVVALAGCLRNEHLSPIKEFLSSILDQAVKEEINQNLMLDFADVSYIDAAFIATLMLFQRQLEKRGRGVVLLNLSTRIERILKFNNVSQRFVIEK